MKALTLHDIGWSAMVRTRPRCGPRKAIAQVSATKRVTQVVRDGPRIFGHLSRVRFKDEHHRQGGQDRDV